MVLEKRKRNGEFEVWTPASSSPTSTPIPSSAIAPVSSPQIHVPPAKKARRDSYPAPIPSSSSAYAIPESFPTHSQPVSTAQKASPGKEKAPPAEKRGAVFKKKCPQNILDRVERVLTQRFFMVDRSRVEGELKEEFQVLGSTGNIYTVTIQQRPSCNCPDAQKGNHCKHILFIYLKVLQVPQSSGSWYQKALLTSELETVFAEAPLAPNALAHPRIREAYARATGKVPEDGGPPSTPEAAGPKKRIPGEEDDCPICYDVMHGVDEKKLTFCETCGNAVHGECFAQWKQTAQKGHNKLTCIYCRAEWPSVSTGASGSGAGAARTTAGGYLNISGVAGVSPVRDTSTYYQGPRRGRPYYGYNSYDDY
ncbi:hypothetical protein FB45DRAFT_1070388 [Roridomyces roridus]|uniref:Uncharacterized protein n=1 Tax=Roridomyces roridus TaxID=1738132 RepID=A0AAD7AYL2_9AGAR|nr:hypothetical protein FB45DRAFT_1070388 [Roridomyces roridus]